jgi:HSP20 family molecular chaperone IbpA
MCSEITPIKTLESITYMFAGAGHSKESVSVKCDVETNTIYVKTKTPEGVSKEFSDRIEFNSEKVISVDKMYDVAKSDVSIVNGIITIVVPTQDKRIKTLEVK